MKLKNALELLLAATIWGVAFVAQSAGMDYVGPFTFNCIRCLIGAAVLVPVIAWMNHARKMQAKTDKKSKKDLIVGGICCGVALGLASNLQQFALLFTTVGKAGFITACYIVIVPVLGLFFGKKTTALTWGAVALAVVGLYLLCMAGSGARINTGDLLLVLCSLLFSCHILIIDHFSPLTDGVALSCIQFLVAGLISGVGVMVFEFPNVGDIFAAWLPILYAGVMSCGVAYTLQIVGQKGMNPTLSSLILSLESAISVLAGWLLLGQVLSGRELLGCVVMMGAIVLAQLPAGKKKDFVEEI